MGELYFPHNSVEVNGVLDRLYKAEDFAAYFGQFIGNGIFPNPSTNFYVQSNNNMIVTMFPGACFTKGYLYKNDENVEIAINAPDVSYNRKDTIAIRLDLTARKSFLKYLPGAPSSNPKAPAITRNDDIYDLKMAEITVRAGTISILQSDILDTRTDGAVCGIVSGVVNSVDTTALFQQYQNYLNQKISEWNSTKQQQQADWQAQMDYQKGRSDIQNSEIQAWYDSVRADITKLQAFNFDNLAELGGCTRTTVKSGNSFKETIVKTFSGDKVAERITTRNSAAKYTETIDVYAEDGVTLLKSSVIETTKQGNGQYQEKIISNSVGGMPQYYTVSPYMGIRIVED